MSYFTCLEAQNVDKYFTFARFWDGRLWEGKASKINRTLRVWNAPGGSKCRILRVWKLKTSINISHLLDFRPREAPTLTDLRPRVGPLLKNLIS